MSLAFFACSSENDGDVDGSFKYGGQTYKTVVIGNQTWMAENLNYNASGSQCYENDKANCKKYGRLYNWETAIAVCPSGWHLPTNEEWDELYRFADSTSGTDSPYKSPKAGKYLKTVSGWHNKGNGEDVFGFAALPSGICDSKGNFNNVGEYGYWWSASECNKAIAAKSEKLLPAFECKDYDDLVYDRYIGDYSDFAFFSEFAYKNSFRSVRCLKD